MEAPARCCALKPAPVMASSMMLLVPSLTQHHALASCKQSGSSCWGGNTVHTLHLSDSKHTAASSIGAASPWASTVGVLSGPTRRPANGHMMTCLGQQSNHVLVSAFTRNTDSHRGFQEIVFVQRECSAVQYSTACCCALAAPAGSTIHHTVILGLGGQPTLHYQKAQPDTQ
jgi:hypothetical protein